VEWELFICGANSCEDVIYKRLDRSLCRVWPMDMWWDELEFHVVRWEECSWSPRRFIVYGLGKWCEALGGKFIIYHCIYLISSASDLFFIGSAKMLFVSK
jgi:hypothetical protein